MLVLALAMPWALTGPDARPALAAAGDLDPTFGDGGKVIADINEDTLGAPAERVGAMVLQPDGRIVVAGDLERRSAGPPNATSHDVLLARYLPNGALDATFGSGGVVTTDFGGDEGAAALVLQADGKLVVAGGSQQGANAVLLVRYLPDGTLDPTFGSEGKVTTQFGSGSSAGALVLQPDGKFVVAGPAGTGSSYDFLLARYLPNGSLDSSFGNDGVVSTDFGGSDVPRAVALQPNGKLIVAGYANLIGNASDFALARYQPNGALDATFGNGGKVITNFGGSDSISDIVVQQDGKLVVAGNGGQGGPSVLLARYLPNGTVDGAFGSGGKVSVNFGLDSSVNDLLLQPDGKLVIAGSVHQINLPLPIQPRNLLVARFLPSGSLDPTFAGGGWVTAGDAGAGTLLNTFISQATAVVMQPDGKLVVAGYGSPLGMVLLRYDRSAAEPRPIGGTGLGITPRSTIDLTWTPGEQQLAYYVARSPTATAMLPDRNATSFTDAAPAYDGNLNCYTVFPLGQNGPLAQSDVLCAQLGHRNETSEPLAFTLRLNQSSTATLSWGSLFWASGYLLLAVPTDGSPFRVLDLPETTTQVTDETGGVFTCYELYVRDRGGSVGNLRTDVACGLPGMSAFPLAAAAAQRSTQAVSDASRARQVTPDKGKLDRLLQEGRKKVEQEAGKRPRHTR
ncbi:MAG: hypothetical protein AB7K36_26230 [Chloroflexota bacterium]